MMLAGTLATITLLNYFVQAQVTSVPRLPPRRRRPSLVFPRADFQVRLVDGPNGGEGRLEVSRNGSTWGNVCNNFFSVTEAMVVCKELGYRWGNRVSGLLYGETTLPVFLDTVMCQPQDTKLSNCFHRWGNHICEPDRLAGVKCSNSSVMLGGGEGSSYGSVKVETRLGWTPVCDGNWTDTEANVVCREMGYLSGKALCCSKLSTRPRSLSFRSVQNVNCNGTEASLDKCNVTTQRRPCSYMRNAAVICYKELLAQVNMSIAVRINKVTKDNAWGRVEVRYMGLWGQICNSGFDNNAATVMCKEAGFKGGVSYGTASDGEGPLWLDSVTCKGNETALKDCIMQEWGKPSRSCGPAHVLCYRKELKIDLVDGGPNYGRIQITYDGQIGSVCDGRFTSNDAKVICRERNYTDGQYFRSSYYGPGTGNVWMSDLVCDGSEGSLFHCTNGGWNNYENTSCANHSRDASVHCVGPVRLYRGEINTGIVQVYQNSIWSTLCETGFDDVSAGVVCRELNYKYGKRLQLGSFGRLSTRYIRPYISCKGNESSILDCSYSRGVSCERWSSRTNYAAVSCYNETVEEDVKVKLDSAGQGYEKVSGRVIVHQHNIWGSICNLYWDNKDADVVCKELNFTGGIAMQYQTSTQGPYLLSNIRCNGNESSVLECPRGSQSCVTTSTNNEAGVLCYRGERPQVRLADGPDKSSGRVEIVYENQVGTICNQGFGSNDASVVCQMLGYVDGEIRINNYPQGTGPVFLNALRCSGSEESIFQCRSHGFGTASEACQDHSKDAEVFCYRNVRVVGGSQSWNYTTGKVQVYMHGSWGGVCADAFSNEDAEVVCGELGFKYGVPLSPGLFGRYYQSRMITDVNCTGSESSILNCGYSEISCPNAGSNYATVACSRVRTETGLKVFLNGIHGHDYAGEVVVERYGTNGTVCYDSWDDKDAFVYCKQLGYGGGYSLGRSYSFFSSTPIWISHLDCAGTENSIFDCPHKENPNNECSYSYNRRALALCYKRGLQIRLAGSQSRSSGRVEIAYDGVWGTVCDNSWNGYDAAVLCKQLGYLDGEANRNSKFGGGTGPIWMNGLQCGGNESSIFACTNGGWNRTMYNCNNHNDDAGVICFGRVRLLPNDNLGALVVYEEGSSALVCDQGFDDRAAGVICAQQGYSFGKAISGSAFGRIATPVSITNVRCQPGVTKFDDCQYDKISIESGCQSYASVVCSDAVQQKDVKFTAKHLRLVNKTTGPLEVMYWGQWGNVCSDGFDDASAMVTCRMLGYSGGVQYKYSSQRSYTSANQPVWLKNLRCSGNEQDLNGCTHDGWTNVTNCSQEYLAAAICYQNKGFEVRLANGSSNHGRVEIGIDNKWGTACGYSWSDNHATVVCRMLNYTSGKALFKNYFGAGSGTVWIGGADCKGTEKNLLQCSLGGIGTDISRQCKTHQNDAGVYCYSDARLSGGPSLNYGRVQVIQNDGTWVSICDENFSNKSADVVCRELGYVTGHKQCCSGLSARRDAPLSNISIQCNGQEKNLASCPRSTSRCRKTYYVSVFCLNKNISTSTEIKVRTKDGGYYGYIEANRYGIWSPICDVGWNDMAANTACKQMAFLGGVAMYSSSRSTAPILLGRFNCTDSDQMLNQCSFSGLGESTGCDYYTRLQSRTKGTAGVMCYNHAAGVQYRLAGGTARKGRVEINYSGVWGTVCDSLWGGNDAKVLCRSMGYRDGMASKISFIGQATGRVWMNNVMCRGNEPSLLMCRASWRVSESSYCNKHKDDAGVECYTDVRLVRGDDSYGRVEVYKDEQWGTVCHSNWDAKDASVVCRQLGYDNGISICCGALGYNFRSATMDSVNCTGTEKSLVNCASRQPTSRCFRLEYASAACYNGERPLSYSSLTINERSNYTGDVLVEYMNITGRICSDGWDDRDAMVVCREMGFAGGEAYKHFRASYVFTNYYGPYWTSEVNCTGNEHTLASCKHIGWGNVSKCRSKHNAGVLCYTQSELEFKLAGGNDNQGRVEIRVDGVWGSVCNSFWDSREATVICRQLGFNGGEPLYSVDFENATGAVWDGRLRCLGNESTLNQCPHEGWKKVSSFSSCSGHRRDAAVNCYGPVRLATGRGAKHGPVLFYHNSSWHSVCDTNFTDITARLACESLGYMDGKAICCSGYGTKSYQPMRAMLKNYTLSCRPSDQTIDTCLRNVPCQSNQYASVTCFGPNDPVDNDYQFDIATDERAPGKSGQVVVTHYNISGRICSNNWDDTDARVLCRSKGYKNGVAYYHSLSGMSVPISASGPFWVGNVSCTGNETSLSDCPFDKNMKHGNCSEYYLASVLCYNNDGIKYRMAGNNTYGRVEVSVSGQWGTVCDSYWDNREADVFCRQLNYSGGAAMSGAKYGAGSGPIWMSHLQCTGNETNLHQCPHRGFNSSYSEFPFGILRWLYGRCSTHAQDAGVYCYDKIRLSRGPNVTMGGVEIFHANRWQAVCDDGWLDAEARIACRTLNFTDGKAVPASAFGNITSKIGVSIHCEGLENKLEECTIKSSNCSSGAYASAYCTHEPIQHTGFALRLSDDRLSGDYHGIVEAKVQGIWGRVCMAGWNEAAANVTCKALGYKGGSVYLHIVKNSLPFVMSNVTCTGKEDNLNKCQKELWGDQYNCSYGANDAGVLCYNGAGIAYRMVDGEDESSGRVEIAHDGIWGTVCDYAWNQPDARVMCRYMGFADGQALPRGEIVGGKGPIWVNGFFCKGNEENLMSCLSAGWNTTFLSSNCRSHSRDAAVRCYNQTLNVTDIRLVGGDNVTTGRVEVYVQGPNQWGTVCDDLWDDKDATVVCRYLGYEKGIGKKRAAYGPGTGSIWYDNVDCVGNETHIQDCEHRGLGVHNCQHYEDASVECSDKMTTPGVTSPVSPSVTSKKSITTVRPTTTQRPTPAQLTTTPRTTTRGARTWPLPEIKTTQPTTKSELFPVTTESTLSSTNISVSKKPGTSPRKGLTNSSIAAAVVVPVLILVCVLIIVLAIFRYKRSPKNQFKHERFDKNVHFRPNEEAVSYGANSLYDIPLDGGQTNTTVNGNGALAFSNGNSDLYNSQLQPSSPGSDNSVGFDNPLYSESTAGAEAGAIDITLPERDEVVMPGNVGLGGDSVA